jgi:hypothetical protein
MRILFGIAIAAVVAFTAWSVEPTVGKTPSTVSLDPHGMMVHTTTAAGSLRRLQHHLLTECVRMIDLRISWPVSSKALVASSPWRPERRLYRRDSSQRGSYRLQARASVYRFVRLKRIVRIASVYEAGAAAVT